MLIHLHSQATTTPKIRAAIQASDEPVSVLAERFGVTKQTVYKWRKRDSAVASASASSGATTASAGATSRDVRLSSEVVYNNTESAYETRVMIEGARD